MIKYIIITIVGFIEAFGTTINSKFRQRSNKIYSFITAFINIIIWYFIISLVVENIKNAWLAFDYALSYSLGDVAGLYFDGYLEKITRIRGFKFFRKKKKIVRRKKK